MQGSCELRSLTQVGRKTLYAKYMNDIEIGFGPSEKKCAPYKKLYIIYIYLKLYRNSQEIYANLISKRVSVTKFLVLCIVLMDFCEEYGSDLSE